MKLTRQLDSRNLHLLTTIRELASGGENRGMKFVTQIIMPQGYPP